MAGFDFNFDNEINNIRKKTGAGGTKPATAASPVKQEEVETTPAPQAVATAERPEPTPREIKEPEPEGFGVSQSHQESNNGDFVPRRLKDPINWKAFKPLRGVFDFVGGDRPVVLHEPIKRTQASGMPEGLIVATQLELKTKYAGASLEFPWGTYTIDETNRVFTTRASLLRYLLFDGLRNADGIHVQYAKQWLVGHIPNAFDENFKLDASKASDELDIYVLLFVAHNVASDGESIVAPTHDMADQLGLMNTNVTRLMDMVNSQSAAFDQFAERSHTLQIVTLLDRMGLLRGGLPKETGEFVRLLEQNRESVELMGETVDQHISAEADRKRVLAREARMKAAYANTRR